uniref:calmodulin-binding protein 60 D-like isoform X2 n=1 Tax=Erigeron canadensis TaxID=72917 RepID=UPI001CB9136B|nr:calmodulin-binding protein 60 D-like isoform X2 [Erigeron canadensis]
MEKYDQNLDEYDVEASASSKPINLELLFPTRVKSPVYTGRPIKGEDGGSGAENDRSIKCMLVDSQTRQQVIDGRVAALNVKLVLIRGDFRASITPREEGTWTSMEFNENIVVNWENKRNLLLGDLSLFVKDGSGTVGEIRIKHDSKPLKNTTFRLGAMVDEGCSYRIKEAISNAFEVKDQRNESKYLRPLSPNDWVWRLNNIRKHGPIHKRLEKKNIWTVRDFLDMHCSNPQALEEIYVIKGKKFDETVIHAKTSLMISNNVCNAYGRNGFISQQSSIEPPLDNRGSIKIDNNCYKPQPSENDLNYSNMIVDHTFSIKDVEMSDVCFLAIEPYQDNQVIGTSSSDGYGPRSGNGYMAKKRWKKLRATIWFWLVGFTKKVRSCLGAP